jgi:predicted DNA-binding transcriptional regulator YafY
MRAERLLRIVFVLQSRGRVTAGELADELEVSARTIQRDMEALSGAGIPVYATRGGEGGWELRREYRTSLVAMTANDVLSIVVGRSPKILADLGLDDPGEGPVLKLMGSVSQSAKLQAEHARQRIHVDIAPWGASRSEPLLPQLQQAIWDDRHIRIRYRESRSSFAIAPLGLVFKTSSWYLVALSNEDYRTYNVSRIHDITVTEERFERPADFDLVRHWERSESEYTETFPTYIATLRLRGDALTRAGWTYARAKQVSEPDEQGWADAKLDLQDEDNALRTIRLLGNDVVVRGPARLRKLAIDEAQAFVGGNTRTHR